MAEINKPFPEWDEADAAKAVTVLDWYKENSAFFEGDHWQQGKGWVGPMPDPSEGDGEYRAAWERLRKQFSSQNAIREVVQRHQGGVIGREPAWLFVRVRPSDPARLYSQRAVSEQRGDRQDDALQQADDLMTAWWDRRNAWGVLQEAVQHALWGQRAILRVWVPGGLLTPAEDGTYQLQVEDAADALDKIHVEVLQADTAALYTDRSTMRRAGVYRYRVDGQAQAELTYVDPATGETVVRIAGGPKGAPEQPEGRFNLGGSLTMYELNLDLLITQQVREQQKALNKAHTMLSGNLDWSGFDERTILNGQPPGRFETGSDGRKRFVPEPYLTGPNVTNFISGITVKDKDGNEQVANPSIHFREPVNVGTFTDSTESAYQAILKECRQMHSLAGTKSNISGETLRQARADFLASLRSSKSAVEAAGRWMLTTVWRMANDLANRRLPADVRAAVSCRLDPGPIPSEDVRLAMEGYRNDVISHETALTRMGVEDTGAEVQKLQQQQRTRLNGLKLQMEVLQAMMDAGFRFDLSAAKAVGLSEEQYEALRGTQSLAEPIEQ